MMKNILKLLAILGMALIIVSCGTTRKVSQSVPVSAKYEIIGLSKTGEQIVEVESVSRSMSVSEGNLRRNLLYDALFVGIQGKKENRVKDLNPMISEISIQEKYKDYFSKVLSSELESSVFVRKYDKSAPSVVRTSGGYVVKTTLLLDSEKLRAELEKQGIIKSLSNF